MNGRTWEQIREEERDKALAKFYALSPEQAEQILFALVKLKSEPMTRNGHGAVDFILKALEGDV